MSRSFVHVIMLMLIAANGSTNKHKKQQKRTNHKNNKKHDSLVSNSTKFESNFSSLTDKLSVLAEVRCPNDAAWKSQVAKILYPVVASRLSPPREGTFDLLTLAEFRSWLTSKCHIYICTQGQVADIAYVPGHSCILSSSSIFSWYLFVLIRAIVPGPQACWDPPPRLGYFTIECVKLIL